MTEPTNRGVILDLVAEFLLRSLIELNRELARRGLTAEDLLDRAQEQTEENEKLFRELLDSWRK